MCYARKKGVYREVDMKRTLLILFAAALVFAAGCKKTDNKPHVSYTEPRIADGSERDDSVVIADGVLSGSAFNWDFFTKRAEANLAAKVTVIARADGGEKRYLISYSGGSFSSDDGESTVNFRRLSVFDAEFKDGTYLVGVLSDRAIASLGELFGEEVPEKLTTGMSGPDWMIAIAYRK